MNTGITNPEVMELPMELMECVAGGHPFEEAFYDTALYRAGVSFVNVIFGSDKFYVNDQKISKDTAKELRKKSSELWKEHYAESGDYVAYAREWKKILKDEYGLNWNGLMGTYSVSM